MSHGIIASRVRGRRSLVILALAAICAWPAAASAAPADPPATAATAATAAAAGSGAPDETVVATAPQESAEEPAIRWDPYGYIKLDVSVDSAAIEPGNYARWVADPALDHQHTHFNITARQTRLGLWILGPEDRSYQVRGRVEVDFYGGGGENKNGLLLRHAYIQIDWPEHDLRLIGGQTSDIISPLVPRTVNYTVAWWSGNIGYRRPLISLTKRFALGDGGTSVSLTGGASRTIGDDFKPTEPGDAGSDSGLPTVQGRAAVGWTMAGRAAAVGFSGHWGQEDLGRTLGLSDPELDSWSANLDVLIPLGGVAVFKAEAFTGKNLDVYFGGIGQGINLLLDTEIDASGGWAAIECDPIDNARFAVGFGLDDPDDAQLNKGERTLNRSIWVNAFYDFTDYLSAAAEASYWATDYKDAEDGTAFRFQASMFFNF